jgi:hypothetical protein
MEFKIDEEKLFWTKHSRRKMRQYNLSEKRVKRVLRSPDRKDLGIAPRTVAVMQITGTKKHPTEIWVMYQKEKPKTRSQKAKVTKIISTWRYPARSPIGEPPPIPEDILWEVILRPSH